MQQQIVTLIERHLGPIKRVTGANASFVCPFPHQHGIEKHPSFSINTDTGAWHCFTCGEAGGIIRLLQMRGFSKLEIDGETAGLRHLITRNLDRAKLKKQARWAGYHDPVCAPTVLSEAVLKPYENCPTNLLAAGFDWQWMQYYDIGWDEGKGRVTWPVRDMFGHLAGVVGGAPDARRPKYKVYQGGTPEQPGDFGPEFDELYPGYTFQSHSFLWNWDRVFPRLFHGKETHLKLIIVEGFKAALHLLQRSYWNTVALMGSSLSELQLNQLRRLEVDYVLFLDLDPAGRKGTYKIGRDLYKRTPGVYVALYPRPEAGLQPDHLADAEIDGALENAIHYPNYAEAYTSWASVP